MIWIRADANETIGTGHIMRCLSVADALRKLGEEVLFLTADEAAEELLTERGQAFRILRSSYREPERELPVLLEMIKEQRPKLLLVDSYFVTEEYLGQLRKAVRLAYMDDYGTVPAPVDILINYNIYAEEAEYEALRTAGGRNMRLLTGPDYAPLRPEFFDAGRRRGMTDLPKKARRVLVTAGGSDRYNLAGCFLRYALADGEAKTLEYHVVSGMLNPHLPYLAEMSEKYPNVHVHQNVKHMAALMAECDMAVTAGGSTVYELCAAGVPFLCFSFVENQRRIVEGFQKAGVAFCGGDYEAEGETLFPRLIFAMNKLAADAALRRRLSRNGRELVDGQGAERLAEALLS